MSDVAAALLHLTAISSFTYSFSVLHTFSEEINNSYGWHFQYLTILGLSLALLTMMVSLISDILPSVTIIRDIKGTISCLAVPVESSISILYWTIHAIDPALLLPPDAPYIDPFTDMTLHLFPTVFLWADMLLFAPMPTVEGRGVLYHPQPLLLTGLFAASYSLWIEKTKKENGYYPYPMMDQMTTLQRTLLEVGAGLMCYGAFHAANYLFRAIRGSDKSLIQKDAMLSKKSL